MINKIIFSPIEQFNLLPLFNICSGLSNLSIFYLIIIFSFIFIKIFQGKYFNKFIIIKNSYYFFIKMYLIDKNIFIINFFYNFFLFIPTRIQFLFEKYILEFINFYKNLVLTTNLMNFFYALFTSISFILFSNIIGLIPYTFTITAQIYITFNLAMLLFISFNYMGFLKHAIMLINLVIPTGVNVYLHFLLIPIEIISYIFRPISLSIRLFANIMAGHTLLKVICGFLFNFIKSNIFFLLILIPFTLITILFGLETFVAFIQTYVFLILLCLFLKDILSLNH